MISPSSDILRYLDSRIGRVIAVVILLLAILGLSVWYGSLEPAPEYHDYPGSGDVANNYSKYIGEKVSVGGKVTDTDPVRVRLTGSGLALTVKNLDSSISQGNHLRIYGVLGEDSTVKAINSVVQPQTGRWYAWITSFLAGLWVLFRIIRYWKIDTGDLSLERRQNPLFGGGD